MRDRQTRGAWGWVAAWLGVAVIGCAGSNRLDTSELANVAGSSTAGASAAGGNAARANAGQGNGGPASPAAGAGNGTMPSPSAEPPDSGAPPADAGSDAALASDAMAPDDAAGFSHGSQLVIPMRRVDLVNLGTYGDYSSSSSLDNLDATVSQSLADLDIYPRHFEVNFGMGYLAVRNCQLSGSLTIATLDVKQDLGASGAHLTIQPAAGLAAGHYILTHDGPGSHQVRVTGTFHPDNVLTGGVCPTWPSGQTEVPVAYTTNIDIRRVAKVSADKPYACAAGSVMLSGRNYPGTSIILWDDHGLAMRAQNVDDTYPLDVIVDTEKSAQIALGSQGLRNDGLVITGEPQNVRLSTSFGTLFSYQLADLGLIDGWEVAYWSTPVQDAKSPITPLVTTTSPVVASGKELGATARLKVGGVPVCSPILLSDFHTSFLTPSVCDLKNEFSSNSFVGLPGFLAKFIDPAGSCELELSVPAANGGKGLVSHLATTLAPAR